MKDKSLVKKKFGHIHLAIPLRKLFALCMAKESTRYAIARLSVGKNEFVVSNGRQLFALLMEHEFEQGLYFVTRDGYCLLDAEGGEFPKWRNVLPKTEQVKTVLDKGYLGEEYGASEVTYELHRADNYFDINMAMPVLQQLVKLQPEKVKVQVFTKEPENHAFIIRGELVQPGKDVKAEFIYVQMPVNK